MTYLEVYKSCVNHFLDNWPETVIELEGSKLDINELDEFARLQVFNDSSSNYTHGDPPNRLLVGHVIVELYVRRGSGIGRLVSLTDLCSSIFSNTRIGDIKFYSSEIVDRQQMIVGETVVDPNWTSKSVISKFMAPL